MKAKNMTLRQHYAGLAMQALIAKTPVIQRYTGENDNIAEMRDIRESIANGAWIYADMMIEREYVHTSKYVLKIAVWSVFADALNYKEGKK